MRSCFLLFMMIALGSFAQTKDYSLNIKDFTEVTIASNINVVYKSSTDSAGYAYYSCSPAAASSITFSNDKNKLKIQLSGDNIPEVVPTVTIYSVALEKASNWGDSTLTIASISNPPLLKLKIQNNGHIIANDIYASKIEASVDAGHGHIHLSGKANEAKYTIRSAGSIEAGNLEAPIVKCTMVGTGSIDCDATDELSVKCLGSGTIYYRGNPEKVKKQGIGGKVVKID